MDSYYTHYIYHIWGASVLHLQFTSSTHTMMVMEFIRYPEIILAALSFLFFRHLNTKRKLPTNWPFVGMLPALLLSIPVIHDWVTDLLSNNSCTFVFKGAWFTNMTTMVITSDPANMRHIFSTNFANYPKGPEFKEFFDILGDGIINVDLESWKFQRKLTHQLINHKKFQTYLEETISKKVNNVLVPVLEHVLEKGLFVDLQDVFKRFSFDSSLYLLMGIDSGCLTTEFQNFPHVDAFDDIEEAIFYRHVLPVNFWKLQRFFGMGKERQLKKGKHTLDKFILQLISEKRHEQNRGKQEENGGVDLLTGFMQEENKVDNIKSEMFLRDTMVTLMLAGRSTISASLTWFFWLVSKNPKIELKILNEIKSKAKQGEKVKFFHPEDLKSLVYLHGALCEALRLYPAIPFEHKRPLEADVLPSGHKVDSTTKILPLLYSIGRMEKVWGKDCLEFKPERWISNEGEIVTVPTYKFMVFNSGPRTCLGKDIAFTQLRMVAATLLYNYHIEVVEGHTTVPKKSVVLYMEGGMKTKIKRRL